MGVPNFDARAAAHHAIEMKVPFNAPLHTKSWLMSDVLDVVRRHPGC
jgi:hypothetical protein